MIYRMIYETHLQLHPFKYKLNRNLNAPPKFYNAGSRKGQILHARLRLECSSLNSDLFRKHIVPSPSCLCGGFKSATYFFFTCPIFTNARQRYLPDNLENFTVRELQFGKENATEQDNQSLFLQVQDFIIKSGRFNLICIVYFPHLTCLQR